MAKKDRIQHRYGICLNDNCPKCQSKEVIQVPARKEFVCPECQKNLRECPPPKEGPNKKLIGAIIVVVAAIVAIVMFTINLKEKTQTNKGKDTTVIDSVPEKTPTDTIVAEPTEEKIEEPKPKPEPKPEPKPQNPNYGTVNLGYGTYTGDLKNGKPHGHGRIKYTREQQIVSSKDFVAKPGDEFEGDFREGKISSMGYWYHDGQQTAVKP